MHTQRETLHYASAHLLPSIKAQYGVNFHNIHATVAGRVEGGKCSNVCVFDARDSP